MDRKAIEVTTLKRKEICRERTNVRSIGFKKRSLALLVGMKRSLEGTSEFYTNNLFVVKALKMSFSFAEKESYVSIMGSGQCITFALLVNTFSSSLPSKYFDCCLTN